MRFKILLVHFFLFSNRIPIDFSHGFPKKNSKTDFSAFRREMYKDFPRNLKKVLAQNVRSAPVHRKTDGRINTENPRDKRVIQRFVVVLQGAHHWDTILQPLARIEGSRDRI